MLYANERKSFLRAIIGHIIFQYNFRNQLKQSKAGVPNMNQNEKYLIIPAQPEMAQFLPRKFE